MEKKTEKEQLCSQCNGKGRLRDTTPKSQFAALDWLSFDNEICSACGGSGKNGALCK